SGSVTTPPYAGGPALGPFAKATYTQRRIRLDDGDIVLMYTDGLIERPGEEIQEGIKRVAKDLEAWRPPSPLGELCVQMVAELAPTPQLDDICVLAVRAARPPLLTLLTSANASVVLNQNHQGARAPARAKGRGGAETEERGTSDEGRRRP